MADHTFGLAHDVSLLCALNRRARASVAPPGRRAARGKLQWTCTDLLAPREQLLDAARGQRGGGRILFFGVLDKARKKIMMMWVVSTDTQTQERERDDKNRLKIV